MKNILFRCIGLSLPIAVIFSTAQLLAYSVTIKNASPVKIDVTIELALCSSLTDSIKAGKTKTIETGGCCSKLVRISPGFLTYTPPDTGLGIACRGYSITVAGPKDSLFLREGIQD